MRTTIRLPEDLLRAAKRHALETHRTLTDVITDALRAALARSAERKSPGRTRLTTVDGDGLRPGIDLDDSAALLDWMEGDSHRR